MSAGRSLNEISQGRVCSLPREIRESGSGGDGDIEVAETDDTTMMKTTKIERAGVIDGDVLYYEMSQMSRRSHCNWRLLVVVSATSLHTICFGDSSWDTPAGTSM